MKEHKYLPHKIHFALASKVLASANGAVVARRLARVRAPVGNPHMEARPNGNVARNIRKNLTQIALSVSPSASMFF